MTGQLFVVSMFVWCSTLPSSNGHYFVILLLLNTVSIPIQFTFHLTSAI